MDSDNVNTKFKENDFVVITNGFYRGQRKRVLAYSIRGTYMVSSSSCPGHYTWIKEENLRLSKNQKRSFWDKFWG